MARRKQQRRRPRGILDVYPRGNRWWAIVPGRGRVALDLSLDTPRDEAYRVAAQRYSVGGLDTRAASAGRESALTKLAELFALEHRSRWSARHAENVAYRMGAFCDALAAVGVARIEHVTADVLARYVEARHREKNLDATINRTIQVARAMARWAARRDPPLCDAGPLASWRNLREVARNRDPLIPSPMEWASVIRELEREPSPRESAQAVERSAANARGCALLAAVAVQSGLRIDELRHLRALDVGADVIRVTAYGAWRPKDREERGIPVPATVADLARELVAWRSHARGVNGRRLILGEHWVNDRLAAAWARAKLPGVAPGMHDARRTFATEMSRRPGVSVRDVQRLLGHADLETTQRYLGRYRSDEARPAVDMGLASVLDRGARGAVLPFSRAVR